MSASTDLLDWLDLEQVDRDIFRGRPSSFRTEFWSLFGGLVAAQALMAAARTVPAGRFPHSLHGYFLRPGDSLRPVLYKVDRDRDGGSFSARRVAALQGGEVIWEMTCSFHVDLDGPDFTQPMAPDVVPAELSVPIPTWHEICDIRHPVVRVGDETGVMPFSGGWVRICVPVPDDRLVHACLHVYTSDLSTGFVALANDELPPAGPSIDHAMWFHHPVRADEWVYFDCSAVKVGGRRGLYTATAHDASGRLVSVLAQEMLLRPPKPAS